MSNVIKYLVLFSTFLIFTNCNVLKDNYYKTETFEIIRKKSNDKTTQMIVNCYDSLDESKIPAGILINGVFFNPFPKNNVKAVLFPNIFDVEIFYIGKQSIKIQKLSIKSGDSIVVNVHMKENLTPLY
ncbi:hypothetical protein MHL31_03075 [Lutibacter sp. A80]|uniref:hypothetical protein n=1 Tax=Lutibacter sp. A80 TaxID=2918453 RepID=UPI001F06EFE2|nr:hypothetical protein [Lutibacter sp. A80]UMB61194.1 hypothetical protein MHL31_03075 [Lutibacter sp. A80]